MLESLSDLLINKGIYSAINDLIRSFKSILVISSLEVGLKKP